MNPNMLPDKAISEFKKIYEEKFGEITDDVARSKAENFISLFDLVTKKDDK